MTKMKKFLALLASLTAVATLGLATACGDKGDSSTPVDSTPPASTPGDSTPDDSTPVEKQYTVTVKKPDGTPAAGYWLQTCVGNNCSTPAQTDANGVFTFTFEEDATVYHVQATNGGGDDYANYEAVDFNTVPGTLTYEVTLVEKAPVVVSNTVAEVFAGENDAEFVLTGTVLANSGKGYVLADATGSIFVYGTTDANVGDIVKVTGTRATFGNCVQLKPTAVEAAEGTAIQAGAIKELTAADCDAYKTAQSMVPEYASFVGTLAVTENKGKTYYNITIDGTEVVGSLVTPTDADKAILADLNGKTVKVEGYVVYVTSGKYLYSVATNISEVIVISEPLSGTGTSSMDENFNSVYDYFVIESGKYYASTADNQKNWADGFTIVSDKDGTYTLNLLEDMNEAPVIVSIEGVEIPRNEADEQLADGFSFPVKANVPVRINVCSYISDETTGWETVYYNAYFGLTFDDSKYEANGTQVAPFALESGSTYTVGETNVYYYFTAPSAGQYKLTVNADWAVVNEEYAGFRFFDANYDALLRGVAVDIAEGETIAFFATNSIGGGEITATTWTFSFGETLSNDENCDTVIDESIPGSSEENPLSIEAVGDYEITVTAGTNFYAQFFGGAFQFVVPEGVQVFTLGTSSGMYSAGQTVAFTDYAKWNSVMYFTITAEADTTVTLSVTEYVVPVALIAGENMIYVSEDALATGGVLCTFTAYVTGQYTFASNDVGARVFDSNDMMVGMGIVNLTEGETYKVLIFAAAAGEYTLTIEAPEATGGEDGGEEGDQTDNVLEVGVAEKVTVVEGQTNEENGLGLTFTPTTYGKYSFKVDLMAVVYDDVNPVARNSDYTYTLNANVEYTIIVYYMPMIGMSAGTYSMTVELKEELTVEEDPTPTIPEDALTLPTDLVVEYTGGGQSGMIEYTIYVENAGTLNLTFDTADTWVIINSATAQVHYVFEKETYSLALDAAGVYTIAIGTWSEKPATMNVSVSFGDSSEGGDDVGGGDTEQTGTVTYLAVHAGGRKLQVVIDATAGTMTLTRSDYSGFFGTGGCSTAEYTIVLDGANTVATNVSGQVCTFVWNADGTPASITWGTQTYTDFTVQA